MTLSLLAARVVFKWTILSGAFHATQIPLRVPVRGVFSTMPVSHPLSLSPFRV